MTLTAPLHIGGAPMVNLYTASSWFPLYDRNPQTYVPNIFFARPGDYRKATQRIFHTAGAASFIDLPVVGKR